MRSMQGIRWKVIAAIMVVIVAVCAIFISQLIHYSGENLSEKISAKEENGRLLTRMIMAQTEKRYTTRIKGFINYSSAKTKEDFIQAFARRDREELYRLTEPFLQIFRKENPYFDTLAWILPDNHMFLRVHGPIYFADDVSSYRPDVARVNRDHIQVAGFSVGPYGMQFRVVEPVMYEGRYLGAIQFGIRAGLLLDTLQEQLGLPAALAVLAKECDNEKYSPMEKLACGSYTVRGRDISLFQGVEEPLDFSRDRQRVTVKGKQYVLLNALPLNNFEGKALGKVIIGMDISSDLAQQRLLVLSAVALSLFILMISYFILFFGIGGLLARIISLNESLNESNKTLEERVRIRTSSLEQEIRDRIETEERLRNSRQRYQTLFDNTGDAIAIYDLDGNFIAVNEALCDRLGYSRREIMDLHPWELTQEDIARSWPFHVRLIQEQGQVQFETVHVRKDGGPVPTEILARLVPFDGKQAVISVARDITDRKREEAEKEVLEAKLRRLKKMNAIGLMAGGVAHDLNNILSGIVGYPELILKELPEDSDLRVPITAIQESGKRAAAVVADLLTVARGVAGTREVISLNDLVAEYLDSPEYSKLCQMHPHISCSKELAPDLLNISCSPVHINKCLMNLVTNGVEAVESSGTVTILTRNQYIDKPVSSQEFMDKGEYVVLTVSDTGSGIAHRDLEHIFEPFYSKKVMGRSGTGLGLAVVWNTVQDHNGSITVTSDQSGTTFELYFPATRENIHPREAEIQLQDLRGRGERILIIDDEPQQQDIAVRMLTSLGYRVDAVGSGEEAVEFLQQRGVDLLILDMIMDPGMNGLETYKRIIGNCPGQKAVIASGFSKSRDVDKTLQLGAGSFIRKPYTLVQLGQAVYQELHS